MIFAAIEAVAQQDADGNTVIGRQALRDALYATSGHDGITGSLSCNENGDCADPKIAVNQITGGAYVPVSAGAGAAEAAAGAGGLMEMEGGLLSQSAPSCDYGGKISKITALDELTVEFAMCKPDPAFLAKAAFVPFFIQPREWIEETGGTGQLLEQPVGTGPYMLESWNRGDSIIFKRFDDYWGEPPVAETLVFRWATEGAARLLEPATSTRAQPQYPLPGYDQYLCAV
jgi:hypothetical protein